MTDLQLFHVDDQGREPAEPVEKLSYGRRLTLRQKAAIERGIHPLTGGKAHPEVGTCGGCAHLDRQGGTAGSYLKCGLGPRSRGPVTDVRAAWPACGRFEARP